MSCSPAAGSKSATSTARSTSSRRPATPSRSSAEKTARARRVRDAAKAGARPHRDRSRPYPGRRSGSRPRFRSGDGGTDEPRQPAGAIHRQGAGRRRGEVPNGERRHRARGAEGPDQRRDHQRRHQGTRECPGHDRREHDQWRASTSTSRSWRNAGVKLGCTNGGIKLRLPRDAKATISASITNGGISTSGLQIETSGEKSRRRLDGRLNGGGAQHRSRRHQRRHHASPAADAQLARRRVSFASRRSSSPSTAASPSDKSSILRAALRARWATVFSIDPSR